MRIRSALAVATSILAAIAACTDAYDEAEQDAGAGDAAANDGGADDVASEARASDGGDASFDAAVSNVEGPCPTPKFTGTCLPDACQKTVVYSPTAQEFPFTIATDADFIYWLTQPVLDALNKTEPYNGLGDARLMRMSRAPGAKAETLVGGLTRGISLALAGPYVYVGVTELLDGGGSRPRLVRVPRTCSAPCALEDVGIFTAGARVHRVERASEDTIFAATDDGTLFRVTVTSTPTIVSLTGGVPGGRTLTATSDYAYFGSGDTQPVFRIASTGGFSPLPFGAIPDAGPDSGTPIGSVLVTDCVDVWGYRTASLVRSPLSSATWGNGPAVSPATNEISFDMGIDEKYIYVAEPNIGGVYAIDKATGFRRQIAGGNIWYLHVDSSAVYWGDHDTNQSGTIYAMSKK